MNEPTKDTRALRLARACADAMWEKDSCSQSLGMDVTDVGPGSATLTMTVQRDMLNGHAICHGGLVFTLADSAFAFACNSYNQLVVAQHCAVSFLQPVYEHDILTARAVERWRQGRSGIYDIVVTRNDGEVVAEFRGHARTIRGQHVDPHTLLPVESAADSTQKTESSEEEQHRAGSDT